MNILSPDRRHDAARRTLTTEGLRPKGFPRALGCDFFLSGYRVFVRFERPGKQTLRGLRILRSDTDRRMMVALGNTFTHYGYRFAGGLHLGDRGLASAVENVDGQRAELLQRSTLRLRLTSVEGPPVSVLVRVVYLPADGDCKSVLCSQASRRS